jgi:anaerobic nitric oxide reductase transcription regulator
MRLNGEVLVPLACTGLVPECSGQRFIVAEHPRLMQFLRTRRPVRIVDHQLPDPFDGLIEAGDVHDRVHACMGCALVVEDQTIGVLAVDALDPTAFDAIDDDELEAVTALAAAAIRNAELIDQLAHAVDHADRVARDLVRDTAARVGDELIGQSSVMSATRTDVELAAGSDLAVLISGETGVGKEVAARAIHARSARRDAPLIYVNCAALPESIAESELFGHTRGAFTGATDVRALASSRRPMAAPCSSTRSASCPCRIQPKLLRVLQSGRAPAPRIGQAPAGRRAHPHRHQPQPGGRGGGLGHFRADLFHRLSVYPIDGCPPLRDRGDDILTSGRLLPGRRAHPPRPGPRAPHPGGRRLPRCATTGRATCASSNTP